jgi:hypothetical protein
MLAERIDSIAPQMPVEVRRWFLEADYAMPSVEHQDWDLVLAEWDFVPLLTEYLDERANPVEKRFEVFSALMVLQRSIGSSSDAERKEILSREIERLVLKDRDFARQVTDECLGVVEALIVRTILGDEIPKDVPHWIHEEIAKRA